MSRSAPPLTLDFVHSLARDAAAVASTLFRHTSARRKKDGTLITEADEAANTLIQERIRQEFPEHGILSEEANTCYDPAFAYTWVIDPIDGTTNFARGLSIWGVSIGLLRHGTPAMAALAFPRLNEVYTAEVGCGAFCNDERLQIEQDSRIGPQEIFTQCTRSRNRYLVETPLKARMLGSAAYHLLAVATGASRAALECTPKIWDLAAAYLIVREAGGAIAQLDGGPIFPLPERAADYAMYSRPVLAASTHALFQRMQASIQPA